MSNLLHLNKLFLNYCSKTKLVFFYRIFSRSGWSTLVDAGAGCEASKLKKNSPIQNLECFLPMPMEFCLIRDMRKFRLNIIPFKEKNQCGTGT
jgi:hypothetical protein